MVMAHLHVLGRDPTDAPPLREWIREAEDRGDAVSSARLRFLLATSLLAADEAQAALALLEAARKTAGANSSSLTSMAHARALGYVQLYRGDADACRASYYVLEEFFSTAGVAAPLQRAEMLLLRARLAVLARAGGDAGKSLLGRAKLATDQAEEVGLPCFEQDVQLMRACIAVAEGQHDLAAGALDRALDPRRRLTLASLFARRARAQLQKTPEGDALAAAADEAIAQRGIANPRRMARLFAPAIEEMLAARRSLRPPA
jgi:hypothetical protein